MLPGLLAKEHLWLEFVLKGSLGAHWALLPTEGKSLRQVAEESCGVAAGCQGGAVTCLPPRASGSKSRRRGSLTGPNTGPHSASLTSDLFKKAAFHVNPLWSRSPAFPVLKIVQSFLYLFLRFYYTSVYS